MVLYMVKPKPVIAPHEIRAIRERLGLSQLDAGTFVGGGPRAFAKYESGQIRPTAAVVNLLRLLEANPSAITTLGAPEPPTDSRGGPSLLDVTGTDIRALDRWEFPQLLRHLLSVEARANNLPHHRIHVASNIDAPDGGIDGRMQWEGGLKLTNFLPSRLTGFQLKSGTISASKAGSDVLNKDGRTVKDMVRSVLSEGGHYIMLCSRAYTSKGILERASRIRQAVRDTGLTINDAQIDFRDADLIAMWANAYPSVAAWVKERATPGTYAHFQSWSHWSGSSKHCQSPWVDDQRLPIVKEHLREYLSRPNAVVRILGLSGIGKSRLVLEALGSTEANGAGHPLKDLVLYTALSEFGSEAINAAVQNLTNSGNQALIVVNDCDPQAHKVLTGMVARTGSGLSLITIDNDVPTERQDDATLIVRQAASSTIEGIINCILPDLPSEDLDRLVRFSDGFPWVAMRIANVWHTPVPVPHVTDDRMVDTFVLGRSSQDRDRRLASAERLAAFGQIMLDSSPGGQLNEIASLGPELNSDHLYADIRKFVDRGVAQMWWQLAVMQPGPIAMKLTERQWSKWTPTVWERVLAGDTNPQLKVLASRQLALINTTDIAAEVLAYVCRSGGSFDSFDSLGKPGHAEVLSNLAEIDPRLVVDCVSKALSQVEDLTSVDGKLRRYLVLALRKVAFYPNTFIEGASIILRFALSENDGSGQLSTGFFGAGLFEDIFPAFLGNTAADGNSRLSFLDKAADTDDLAQRLLIVQALLAGAKTGSFRRLIGDETHGSRPALISWHPTWQEFNTYVEECVNRLIDFALGDDEAAAAALAGLGDAINGLILSGFINLAEKAICQLSGKPDYWPEAVNSLGRILAYHGDGISPDVAARVNVLEARLRPNTIPSRVQAVITNPPLDCPLPLRVAYEAQHQRPTESVRELTAELVKQPAVLSAVLSTISHGRQEMAFVFGKNLAELVDSPSEWLTPIVRAALEAPASQRNLDLLAGFATGLNEFYPDAVDEFKGLVVRSPELAPAFPLICSQIGIAASDIPLAIRALEEGILPANSLRHWYFGAKLADMPASAVAPLFDAMLEHSVEAFTLAVELIGSYCYHEPWQIDDIKPQIIRLAQNATRWNFSPNHQIVDHHFRQVMDLMLSKGRQDPDARATVLALTKALTDMGGLSVERFNDGWFVKPVLPTLLSDYPELSWPLIGQAVISDHKSAFLLKLMLQEPTPFEPSGQPPILSLPEDALFAWCHAYPDSAPAFAASVLPILTGKRDDGTDPSLHPVMSRLIDEFGDRDDVLKEIANSICPFGGSGSMSTADEVYSAPLAKLSNHQIPAVRRWATSAVRQLDAAAVRSHDSIKSQETGKG